jgi:phosphoglycolate phosphatase-like HAD superfamily hydrolase
MKKLLLWDIDGTLLDTGGAGTRAMDLAFQEVFSIEGAFQGIRMSGKTDTEIMKEALRKHSIAVDGKIPVLIDAYIGHLKTEIERPTPQKGLKPGVIEALSALSRIDGVATGLLTGNLEEGARLKLAAFGLNRFFPAGAFGSDHEDRNRLLPVAAGRFALMHMRPVFFRDCVVIGDTPRDIACAKPYGAVAFSVATGRYSVSDLKDAGADAVMEDLSDTEEFMRRLNLLGCLAWPDEIFPTPPIGE